MGRWFEEVVFGLILVGVPGLIFVRDLAQRFTRSG
jgi:hypothetical protein